MKAKVMDTPPAPIERLLFRSRSILLYAASMAVLVFLLKWLQWKFLITDHSTEIYIGLIALLFTLLGIWIAGQLAGRKVRTVVLEKEVIVEKQVIVHQSQETLINETELQKLELTTREHEVLQLLARGCSNAEIAGRLFLSISTVKTHVSNLLVKLDVRNRTQAAEKANRLRLVRPEVPQQ